MGSPDKNMIAVEPFNIGILNPPPAVRHGKIPHMHHGIFRFYNFVVPVDQGLIHLIHMLERPIAIFYDVAMAIMFVSCEEKHSSSAPIDFVSEIP
jgi:hypothetical protein